MIYLPDTNTCTGIRHLNQRSGANNLTLVTHNTRESGRVQGLRLEDWKA